MAEVHLLLGSNLGDRQKNLQMACDYLNQIGTVRGVSQVYITQPWGFESNDIFFNQAVLLETKYFPTELLKKTQYIENIMGREGVEVAERYTSRLIDIDIIFYENLVINEGPELVIPHPRMAQRRFVLEPLCQLSPNKLHPLHNKTSRELLTECEDQNFVIRL